MLSVYCDPIALAILGLGGVVLGLAELGLSRVRRFPTWGLSLTLVTLIALAGAAAFSSGEGQLLGQPALVLAAVGLTLLLVRSRTSFARRHVVQGAGLALLGATLLFSQIYVIERGVELELDRSDFELSQMGDPIDESAPPAQMAASDAGAPVALFHVQAGVEAVPVKVEERYLGDLRLQAKVIQTGPSDVAYNCHGWVFADGHYWVRSRFVETILKDNGYQAVEQPKAGDVAVFRNHLGEVTHSGLVRASGKDGNVLLESKWGRYGRYVHTPEDHCYRADKVTYYHTTRGSHLLKGIEYPEGAVPVTAE
jgi:hypothetical protein